MFYKNISKKIKNNMETIGSFIGYAIGIIFLGSLLSSVFIVRHLTMKELTIHPSNYEYTTSRKGNSVREVFADEGEYRIEDSMYPWNYNSAGISNKIQHAITAKKACKIKTFWYRSNFFSMYPVIYDANCENN